MPTIEETSVQPVIKFVFFDSNCLVKGVERSYHFQNLLRLAKQRKIKLVTSAIVFEEWISHIRDDYLATCARFRADKMYSNPLFEAINGPDFEKNNPKPTTARNDMDRQAREYVENFKTQHDIEVIDPAPDHAGRVFRKYCGWEWQFAHGGDYTKIDDSEFRALRKRHLPDGFIAEAAIDFGDGKDEFYVVSEDNP